MKAFDIRRMLDDNNISQRELSAALGLTASRVNAMLVDPISEKNEKRLLAGVQIIMSERGERFSNNLVEERSELSHDLAELAERLTKVSVAIRSLSGAVWTKRCKLLFLQVLDEQKNELEMTLAKYAERWSGETEDQNNG